MSKVQFRNRQIDYNKKLVVRFNVHENDLPDSDTCKPLSAIPSGMEKNEETEKHLQLVLNRKEKSDCVIPIPDVYSSSSNDLYSREHPLPSCYIHTPSLTYHDATTVDYDLDSEDELWLNDMGGEVAPAVFEYIMDQCEKSCANKVLKMHDAQQNVDALLRNLQHESCELNSSFSSVTPAIFNLIYDYWVEKRLQRNRSDSMLLQVKKQHPSASRNRNVIDTTDPYIAFRRRNEHTRVQTRKNRKTDENSYRIMFEMKQQLNLLKHIARLTLERENVQQKLVANKIAIFKKRYQQVNKVVDDAPNLLPPEGMFTFERKPGVKFAKPSASIDSSCTPAKLARISRQSTVDRPRVAVLRRESNPSAIVEPSNPLSVRLISSAHRALHKAPVIINAQQPQIDHKIDCLFNPLTTTSVIESGNSCDSGIDSGQTTPNIRNGMSPVYIISTQQSVKNSSQPRPPPLQHIQPASLPNNCHHSSSSHCTVISNNSSSSNHIRLLINNNVGSCHRLYNASLRKPD